MRRLQSLIPVVSALLAIGVTLGVAALGLRLAGYDPGAAAGALLRGAAGSGDQLLSITLVRATPLVLTGLAVAIAFRAGVWNIGAEGQFYAGAVAAVVVGLAAGGLPGFLAIPLILAAASAGGLVWAWGPALMKVRLGVGEVITTILMNFVAIYLTAYLVHGPLQEQRGVFPQTDPIAAAARLPRLVPGSRLHVGFLVAVVLALCLWVVMRHAAVGFRVRAIGASPEAARISGRIDSRRTVLGTFLVSGALAGVAGGVEVAGVTFALYENLSPGYGYTAIAVALLAGLDPLAVLVTGVFFGALEGGASAMQREAGIPAVWVDGVEALVILAVLAFDRLRGRLDRGWRRDRVRELPAAPPATAGG